MQPSDPRRVKVVPSPKARADIKDDAGSTLPGVLAFSIALPQLDASIFPIRSQEDLEAKLFGKVSRIHSPGTNSPTAPRLPSGYERTTD